jgi:hypothetical protein
VLEALARFAVLGEHQVGQAIERTAQQRRRRRRIGHQDIDIARDQVEARHVGTAGTKGGGAANRRDRRA